MRNIQKKTIFLITPPKNLEESLIMGFKWSIPHIGLGYLSAFIGNAGYDVKIFDLTYFPYKKFLQRILSDLPHVVGITATTEEYYSVKRTCRIIKKYSPNSIIILGGPHATPLPKETLEEILDLDFCVVGEGELTFKELLDEIFSSKNFQKIKGIAYRDKDKIVITPERDALLNLDELPFPSWEKFNLTNYKSFSEGILEHFLELPIITQRGCPYNCVFCQKTLGPLVRKRSIENVFEEIRRDYEEFHISRICIVDETFSTNKRKVIEFCKKFRKEGYHKKITWSCFTRVNLVDEELIRYMKAAGCRLISFGIESGNQEILNIIKKEISLDQAIEAIRLTRKYKIESHYGIIFGHPFETIDTMKDSLKFVLKNRPDLITFAILVPFPGTEVAKYCNTHYGGLKNIAKSWLDYHKQMGRALELKQIPRKYLDFFQLFSYALFFFHPYNIMKILQIINLRSIPKYFLEKLKNITGIWK